MNGSGRRWIPFLAAVILSALVGIVAYNAGVAHGLAVTPPSAGTPMPYPWHPYGWYHPFGFFPLFPLFFLFGFFLLARLLFWGGYRRGWQRGGWYGGVPPGFDEWHRRAHEGDRQQSAASSPLKTEN